MPTAALETEAVPFTGITELLHTEVEVIRPLLEAFNRESGYNQKAPVDLSLLAHVIERGSAVVFVYLSKDQIVGTLGALIGPSLFSPSELRAQELFWYVKKEHRAHSLSGIKLLKAYEAWSQERGADSLTAVALDQLPEVVNIYERTGYKKLETHFLKVWPSQR